MYYVPLQNWKPPWVVSYKCSGSEYNLQFMIGRQCSCSVLLTPTMFNSNLISKTSYQRNGSLTLYSICVYEIDLPKAYYHIFRLHFTCRRFARGNVVKYTWFCEKSSVALSMNHWLFKDRLPLFIKTMLILRQNVPLKASPMKCNCVLFMFWYKIDHNK